MKRKVGILLSGCGSITGSDPFEVAFLSSVFEKNDFEIFHLSASAKFILRRASEFSMSKLYPLKEISPKILDVLVIPGGQGVLWNLLRKNGQPKKEVQIFLREIHSRKGIIVTFSLGTNLLTRTFIEYQFNFDLLSLKSGNYFVNKDLNFIVAPGTIAANSALMLSKEIEAVVKEIDFLLKCDK